MVTCGEAVISILQQYGVDTVFGIPGVHTIELYRGLPASEIKHISARHEQGVGFMADGYARTAGKPGVCFVISGPGTTNIATAMGQALQDSIPLLVISSVTRSFHLGMGEGRLHELPNQSQTLSGVSLFSHTLMRADELPKVMARAFAVFNSKRPGPIHIEIPVDVLKQPMPAFDNRAWPLPEPPAPSFKAISSACALLREAQRPMMVIGGGAINAGELLVSVAEKLDAPVANTVNAKGVIPYSHPLVIGGSASSEVVREELQKADVILAIGTEFSETDFDFYFAGDIQLKGKLVRIDIDAEQLVRNVQADIAIVSDAVFALEAIDGELSRYTLAKKAGHERTQEARKRLQSEADQYYAAFFNAIREVLPEVVIVGDSTQPTYHAWLAYETEAPRRYFHSASGYGTLGYAIPAAIGAKLGTPDSPVMALVGDGGAQYSAPELICAVELQLNVIFLIWNNQGYAEIRRFMEDANIATIGVDLQTPDFADVSRGFGCQYALCGDLDELKLALRAAADRRGPTVIEVTEKHFAE